MKLYFKKSLLIYLALLALFFVFARSSFFVPDENEFNNQLICEGEIRENILIKLKEQNIPHKVDDQGILYYPKRYGFEIMNISEQVRREYFAPISKQ